MLRVGDVAPEFALLSAKGETVRLSDFRGRKVVVYFYPRAGTPGCTREACDFQTELSQFQQLGVPVIGISPDPPERLAKFQQKYNLSFPLLSDPDHRVAEAYGVWVVKTRFGKQSPGIERTTFIVDEQGRVAKIFPKVKVDGHVKQVLAALQSL